MALSSVQKPTVTSSSNFTSLFNFPCSLLLLDDDEVLLSSLKRSLGRNQAVEAFSSTTKAFQRIIQSQTICEQAFEIFEPYLHEIEGAENGDDLVLIKSSRLEKLAASAEKYQIISVAIIDQIMPRISGTEFCKQIENTGTRKILLTGQMTSPETIDAFNAGLIDGYVSKNDPEVKTKLQVLINKLHKEFIREQTEHVARAFDASHRQFLGHHAIPIILQKAQDQFAHTEFFYMPGAPGFLLMNQKGDRFFCLIDTDQNQKELAGVLAESEGETDVIKDMRDGNLLCWNPFDRPGDAGFDDTSSLDNRLFPCDRLSEFRWCMVPIDKTPYGQDRLPLNWLDYMIATNARELNQVYINV